MEGTKVLQIRWAFLSVGFYKADEQYISEIPFVNYKKCIYLPQI